jgi:hypothetical protein
MGGPEAGVTAACRGMSDPNGGNGAPPEGGGIIIGAIEPPPDEDAAIGAAAGGGPAVDEMGAGPPAIPPVGAPLEGGGAGAAGGGSIDPDPAAALKPDPKPLAKSLVGGALGNPPAAGDVMPAVGFPIDEPSDGAPPPPTPPMPDPPDKPEGGIPRPPPIPPGEPLPNEGMPPRPAWPGLRGTAAAAGIACGRAFPGWLPPALPPAASGPLPTPFFAARTPFGSADLPGSSTLGSPPPAAEPPEPSLG